ncbi:MAG: hypothetical protein ABFD12_05655 [Syntrophorhabdus sp.]
MKTIMLLFAITLAGAALSLGIPGCALYYDEGYDRDRLYDEGYYYGDGRYYRYYDGDGYEHRYGGRDDDRRGWDGHRDWDDRYERRERWGR